jgi:hypothetical protein
MAITPPVELGGVQAYPLMPMAESKVARDPHSQEGGFAVGIVDQVFGLDCLATEEADAPSVLLY